MSEYLPTIDQIYDLTQQATAELAESLNEGLQSGFELAADAPVDWQTDSDITQQLQQPGLVLTYQFDGGAGYLVVIPEDLPLPAWYKTPDETEQARLQNLAVEWQFRILPEDAIEAQASTNPSNHLANAIEWSAPLAHAQAIRLLVSGTGGAAEVQEGENIPAIWIVGPVEAVPAESNQELESDLAQESEVMDLPEFMEPEEPSGQFAESPQHSAAQLAIDPQELISRTRRLMRLNVKVSVRLAEMKIQLNSLVNLCPGTLLVFPKSCDDLLDLYVNNQLYAQGEAVKIGEKFGLKVNQVGVKKQRPIGVFSL